MRRSTDRILTTHVGSLPRPHDLLDVLKARLDGETVDQAAYDAKIADAVDRMVAKQAEAGIDIVADGEMSKPGHAIYIEERLSGYEQRPGFDTGYYAAEKAAFPEYYEDYFARAHLGGAIAPAHPVACVGPVEYVGHDALNKDLENLKASCERHGIEEAFMPCAAVTGVGFNEYYATQEEYMYAVADALAVEYNAIIDAGFLLQVDDPFLPHVYMDKSLNDDARLKKANLFVETVNHSIKGIPEDKIRYHTCYGINQGPRVYEPDLPMMINEVLKVNAAAFSFEAGNPRHEHEYHLWEHVKLPDGKLVVPGVITHATSVVEHPEYIAERIIRFAERCGRENVIASTDCGFSSQAIYKTEVENRVVWAKLKSLADGAEIASAKLWQ
ncbi:MAG: cobalamin-independent methionine synthase II family protein [Pseudomonadota bacterium]